MERFLPLKKGGTVALCACSDPVNTEAAAQIEGVEAALSAMGFRVQCAKGIYAPGLSDHEKTQILQEFYENEAISAIFDLSGGDLANGVLSCLDMELLREHPKPFFGYSDLTTLLNGIYTAAGIPGGLYSVRNLCRSGGAVQRQRLEDYLLGHSDALIQVRCRFVQGASMEGIVVGGNLRCLLKLAGTPYFPDLRNRILLLESRGGGLPQMTTMLHQLRQIGAFSQVNGVLLGTFTQYQRSEALPIEELVRTVADNPTLPIAKTEDVGHGADAHCVEIGIYRRFVEDSDENR